MSLLHTAWLNGHEPYAYLKDVLDQQRIARVSESLRYVAVWNSAMLPSKDLTEGITATFEKRPPTFTGE